MNSLWSGREGSISAFWVIIMLAEARLINPVFLQHDRQPVMIILLKLTPSHPRMIQSFVILLQRILWSLTMTLPQEGQALKRSTRRQTHTAIYMATISLLTLCGWLVSPSAAIPQPAICPGWDISNHHFKWGKVIWNANSATKINTVHWGE